jgi:hypothetical protein
MRNFNYMKTFTILGTLTFVFQAVSKKGKRLVMNSQLHLQATATRAANEQLIYVCYVVRSLHWDMVFTILF